LACFLALLAAFLDDFLEEEAAAGAVVLALAGGTWALTKHRCFGQWTCGVVVLVGAMLPVRCAAGWDDRFVATLQDSTTPAKLERLLLRCPQRALVVSTSDATKTTSLTLMGSGRIQSVRRSRDDLPLAKTALVLKAPLGGGCAGGEHVQLKVGALSHRQVTTLIHADALMLQTEALNHEQICPLL
jgi:hypothetical protein